MRFLGDKRSLYFTLITVFMAVISGCNQEQEKQIQKFSAAAKPDLMQPFRFHKLIEVTPGNSFDVFSWGRGIDSTGSLLILASDSSAKKYTTTTGDLEGAITDVYNTDMDMDGNPEILIQAKAKDSTVHTQIYAFEYNNNKAQKLDFPKLTSSQRKGYRGEDNFYIKEGLLMREFPVFDGNGSSAKPTGQKRVLEYGLRSNNFTVKTVEQTDPQKIVSAKDTSKNTTVVTPVSTKNTSQKKHHTSEQKPKTEKSSHKRSSGSGKNKRRHRR
ncbi:MAG: hypothetical protein EOP42_20325 [Sphingobacteriaceae bacterium]|nr:MAG: hypothetical protein EOP42_20325 [Sphingobacteriaceae bacterium]